MIEIFIAGAVTGAIACGIGWFVHLLVNGRDSAAQDRDRGVAKLYGARAKLLRIEVAEREAALYRKNAGEQRVREARHRRRRDAVAKEARHSL